MRAYLTIEIENRNVRLNGLDVSFYLSKKKKIWIKKKKRKTVNEHHGCVTSVSSPF